MATQITATSFGFLQHRAGDLVKGRYEVIAHLGGGNFGSVYRVRDNVVGNTLACKEMHVLNNPNTPADERAAALDLFKREALTLATLRHPHIPAAYFEQEDGDWNICPFCGYDFEGASFCPSHGARLLPVAQRFYLLMDFVDGVTLEQIAIEYFKKHGRPLPSEKCLEWMSQVGSALASLHKLGVVHRDIKPDNIKVRNSDGAAILLDFGLTKKVEEAGGYGTSPLSGTGRFGTAGYAPPSPQEQLSPESRSDIYALGMTLYRLVSARDPQDEEQLEEMRSHSPRYFNPSLSVEIDRIIREATASDRAERTQKIDDFLADINELRAPAALLSQSPPFTFSDGSRARNSTDLARLLELHRAESQNYLFNGMFSSWLLQNGYAASAKAADDVIRSYAEKPAHALEVFRRALFPSTTPNIMPHIEVRPASLSFGSLESGQEATLEITLRNSGPGFGWGTVEVEYGDDPANWGVPMPGLRAPHVWEGNCTLPIKLDTGRAATGAYAGTIVVTCNDQKVRIPLSYTVRPLELLTEPTSIDFGVLPVGTRVTRQFKIRRTTVGSKGIPRGTIYAGTNLAGLRVPERFSGEEPIEVVLDGTAIGVSAMAYEGALQLDTNGGRLRIPVTYVFVLPFSRLFYFTTSALVLGAAGGILIRLAYALVNPNYGWSWLASVGVPLAALEIRTPAPLIIGSLGGFLGGLRLMRSDLIKPRLRTSLGPAVPLIGMAGGGVFGLAMAFALHWSVWGLGDWMLRPLVDALGNHDLRQYAPLAWGLTGAIIGGALGIGRVFAAVGLRQVRYGIYAVLTVAFFLVLINAMLHV